MKLCEELMQVGGLNASEVYQQEQDETPVFFGPD